MTQPLRLHLMLSHADGLFYLGEYHAANRYFEEVAADARSLEAPEFELRALSGLAAGWGNLGNFTQQAAVSTQMLTRARAVQESYYISDAALHLAYALGSLDPRNHWPTIRATLDEGMAAARRLHDPRLLIFHLIELSKVAVDVKHDPAAVTTWLDEATAQAPPYGRLSAFVQYRACRSRARLWQDQGDPAKGWQWAQEALRQAEEHGGLHVLYDTLALVAELDQEQGRPAEALARAKEIVRASVTHKWLHTEYQGQAVRAEALLDLQRLSEAQSVVRRALELAHELALREKEVIGLIQQARVLLALDEPDRARGLLEQAHTLAAERRYPDHVERAGELLSQIG